MNVEGSTNNIIVINVKVGVVSLFSTTQPSLLQFRPPTPLLGTVRFGNVTSFQLGLLSN